MMATISRSRLLQSLLIGCFCHSLLVLCSVLASHHECPDGYFGWKCHFKCQCKNNDTCDKVTGACPAGCKSDHWGDNCQLDSNCAYHDQKGIRYMGKLNRTDGGGYCQHWKDFGYTISAFPDNVTLLEELHNYCRNPTNDNGQPSNAPWCYTHKFAPTWGFCSIQQCDCPGQLFGQNCQRQCHCKNSEVCDRQGGACPSGCEAPWSGPVCHDCRRGRWGLLCEKQCVENCKTGCYKSNGSCCPPFKIGPSCKKDVPSLKTKPWNSTVTSSSIRAVWYMFKNGSSGSGVGPVRKYLLKYKRIDDTWTNVNVSALGNRNVANHTIHGLKRNSEYVVRVACYLKDEVGEMLGRFSPTSDRIKTDCNDPSTVDLNANDVTSALNEERKTKTSLTVKWNGVIDSGCDSVTFSIKYRRRTPDGDAEWKSWPSTLASSKMFSETVIGLEAYTDYQVRVEAKNNQGKTSLSNTVDHRTVEGVPDKVEDCSVSVSSNQLTVTWNQPKHLRGVITKYIITCKETYDYCSDHSITNLERKTFTLNTEYTFIQLTPYHGFEITIVAVNVAGEGEAVRRTVITKQSDPPPVHLYGNDVTSTLNEETRTKTSLTVKWNGVVDYGCDYFTYSIKYRRTAPDGDAEWKSLPSTLASSKMFSETVIGLEAYTDYQVRVEAKNNEEKTSLSNTVDHRTVEGVSGKVKDSRESATDSTKLTVTWKKPDHPRGVIKYYVTSYRKYRDRSCDTRSNSDWSSGFQTQNTEFTFSPLKPYHTYQIKIVAVNGAGYGEEDTIYGYTEQSVPLGSPPNLKAEPEKTYARITWDSVPCDQSNGYITQYQYNLKGLDYSIINDTANIDSKYVYLRNLTPYARYGFKVRAITKAGPSLHYSRVDFQTLEAAPPKPENVNVPNIQFDSFLVKWTTPYPPHGIIRYYEISYRNHRGGHIIKTNRTQVMIDKLVEPSSYYWIEVRAATSAGKSDWSETVKVFTEEGFPSEPESLLVIDKNLHSLSFTWKPPTFPNGQIRDFKLICGQEVIKEFPADVYNATIDGLSAGHQYNCSIQARTSKGYGDKSHVSTYTLPAAPSKPEVVDTEPEITDSTITFVLPRNIGIRASSYEVHVDKDDSKTRKRRDVLHTDFSNFTRCSKKSSDRDVYITAELLPDKAQGTFTVGDGKEYGGYWNCPLVKKGIYSIYYAAVARNGGGDTSRSFVFIGKYEVAKDTSLALKISIPSVAVLLCIFAVVLVLFLLRRKKKKVPTATLR